MKDRLLQLIQTHALSYGDFLLSSGKKSSYYIDGKKITLQPEGAYLVARLFLDMLKDNKVDAIGGLTLGADPIAGALAAISYKEGRPIQTFIVRKEAKGHGSAKLIEGAELKKGMRVVVIDDVVTTAASTLKAVEACRAQGAEVARALCIVDREEGGRENLLKLGVSLQAIFRRADLVGTSPDS